MLLVTKARRVSIALSVGLVSTLAGGIIGMAPAHANSTVTENADYSCVEPGPRNGEPDWFGDARLPYKGKIHPTERPDEVSDNTLDELMVNPGYTNVSRDGVTLRDGVGYLWVINEDEDLILGIENTAKTPQAFDPAAANYLQDRKLGHPTLAVKFLADGRAVIGKGRVSGELFQIDGKWTISDDSGRYSAGRTEDMSVLLGRAAKLFEQNSITVQCKLFIPA